MTAVAVVVRPALTALAALAFLLTLAAPAAGHALIRSTEPAAESVVAEAPNRVVLRFTEPVEAAFGAIRVYDTAGRRVDDGRAAHLPGEPDAVAVDLRDDLADGTYTVSWRVVSADGHPVGEAFLFHVGEPGADAEGALQRMLAGEAGAGRVGALVHGLSRWALFAGLVLAIGAWAFAPLVSRPAGMADGRVADARGRAARLGWWLALVATLVGMFAQIAVAAGLPLHEALRPGLFAELLRTRYGLVALARLGLLVVAALAWQSGGADRAPRLTALLALALACTPGLAGHAGALRPTVAHVLVDGVHVLAAAVWLGGLVVLWRTVTQPSDAPVAARFSRMAPRAVGLLVLTGVMRSSAEVGALGILLETDYGVTLLVKLAVFVPLLLVAAVNRFRIQPRLLAQTEGAVAVGTLRRLVAVEVVLGVVVLAVTAVLVNLPPAKVEAGLSGPFVTEVALGEGTAQIVVDPNRVGENIVHVTMLGPDSRPMEAESLLVRFRLPAEGIGPIEGEGIRLGPGHFAVQGRQLSVPGVWVLEIVATVDRFTDVTGTVSVRLSR